MGAKEDAELRRELEKIDADAKRAEQEADRRKAEREGHGL